MTILEQDFESTYPEWAGRTFLVTDTHELLITLDGSEQAEPGDTVEEIVSRHANDFPTRLWDLVDREIMGASS